jgi:hypothetical protein
VWPSLLLWHEVAASASPRRRRIEPLLIYECAAVLLISLAAAEPSIITKRRGDPVVVLFDQGEHMLARRRDGKTALEATLAEVRRMGAGRIVPAQDGIEAVARGEGDWNVIATTRPGVEGKGIVVVGRAPHGFNLGVDAVEVRKKKLWFAIATDGPPLEADVLVGGKRLKVPTGRGVWTDFDTEIEILTKDNYDGDDAFVLRRTVLGVRDETGSRYVAAALKAGTPTLIGNDLLITTEAGSSYPGVVRGADCVAYQGIFDGLFLDECAWHNPKITVQGEPLLTYQEKALAAWQNFGRTLWLGLPLHRDWDEHGTLALVIERAKRQLVEGALGPEESLVGDAIITPKPGHVWTKGVDRRWNGVPPEPKGLSLDTLNLRLLLGLLGTLVLALYLRAIVHAP